MKYETGTVKPLLRDHCHKRPPVLKDQIFLAEIPTFWCNYKPVTKDHLSWETTIICPIERSFKTGSTVVTFTRRLPTGCKFLVWQQMKRNQNFAYKLICCWELPVVGDDCKSLARRYLKPLVLFLSISVDVFLQRVVRGITCMSYAALVKWEWHQQHN